MSETETTSSNRGTKIAMIVIGLSLIVVGIIMLAIGVDIPKWLFMGLFIGGICVFFGAYMVGAPHREARRYLKDNGDFDMDTPRSYEPMKVTWMQNFIGLGLPPLKRNMIARFDYADKRVRIEMANGDVLDAPLSEIKMIVRKNPKGEGATGYELRHGDTKIFPLQNTSAFEELEIEDMWNILYRCSDVREPGALKALSIANKIISTVGDATSGPSLIESFAESKLASVCSPNDAEMLRDNVIKPNRQKKKKSVVVKVLLWVGGFILTLFVGLILIGIFAGDEDDVFGAEKTETLALNDFDENKTAYIVGGTADRFMVIPVNLTKSLTIKSDVVTAITSDESTIIFNVEKEKSGNYLLRADGNPGVWGAQSLELASATDEDGQVVLSGTFDDTSGESFHAEFIIMQPKDGEEYYLGNIGDQVAFFVLNFERENDSSFTGTLIMGENPVPISGSLEGKDEYGDPIYSVSTPDMSLTITWWSNGGESGFTGNALVSQHSLSVSAQLVN